ncbi:MAG TPA: hypothetical protein PKB14_25870 [Rubrivivax sp.]|nr:hypothetical protein [Rubrivivax sp.]
MSAHRGWHAALSRGIARHRAPQGQHLLPGAGPEGDAVRDGRGLQRPQRTRLFAVSIRLGQAGPAHVLDQHAPAREHIHQPGDDRLQQRMHLVVGGRARFNELRHAIGTTPVRPRAAGSAATAPTAAPAHAG